ncbi:MAG: bifunctional 2-C-methyl-D-erythritol 4-phosphate cytidylyltransferase/2-C-methyl-D-erythritol 2,4-cyclodiphosphate synthase [Rhodospirillales bacterium]|nr:bifunctional 2-C-methyl-D-erythritol 4-phosphate cytidylyltransferase/2-C-methyl-D-erythritol 2,4-cyclodiphosphate synthase [Rhodospirillales bacterium]MBO6786828.1 bifunctional 2-C-methyl-D-erythritol 4-phosphate cytidylyltransferase/2-C-methyl-D-erythritol 2,4-cyclodiphosphate synthase [Rhodospirillales bacterium]
MPGTAVIIVAAGRGHRFGAEMPKQFLRAGGAPLIRHAVAAFISHASVDVVLPVIHPDDAEIVAEALDGLDVMAPVAGGAARQDSVRNGLEALASMAPDIVLVHDAARPLVAHDMIDRVLEGLGAHPGVIPALQVVDTLKRADAAGVIADTVSRDGLWRAQTPQGFRYDALLQAHRAAAGQELTDDAAVMEAAGHKVGVVAGDDANLKVTTPEDLGKVERMMADSTGKAGHGGIRVGNGFDVHKLGPGDHVTLCGIDIAHDQGLIGHSDADVALHALCDAIFGALGDGDIGSHFPPSDEQWRGAPSDRFLAYACARMRDRGFELGNADITIICERPKIGPHRDAMRARIAEVASTELSRVSVKATTTEKLGFTGRGEGIAAQASVLLVSEN